MSGRSGRTIDLSGLPRPVPPTSGIWWCSPTYSTGLSRATMARMMSMYSRVRARGLAYSWAYQPSTTCGPLTPRPRMKRPPVR